MVPLMICLFVLGLGGTLCEELKRSEPGGASSYSQVVLGNGRSSGGRSGYNGGGSQYHHSHFDKKSSPPSLPLFPVQLPKPLPLAAVPLAIEKPLALQPVKLIQPVLYPVYKEPVYLAKVPPFFQPYPNTYGDTYLGEQTQLQFSSPHHHPHHQH